jgi:predicted RNA-binding protein with PUA domain
MNPVNKNLVGTGYLTTDQKKKLLWGKKKSTASEESAHRWDNASALIGDPERQEKFNKLMGVKAKVVNQEQNLGEVEAEKQKELQMDLEKQYTAGLRRRDGRTVGLGL